MNSFAREEIIRLVRCRDEDTPDSYAEGEIVVQINGPFVSAGVRCKRCGAVRRFETQDTEEIAQHVGSSERFRANMVKWFDGHTCRD